jgi:hypothetical protein
MEQNKLEKEFRYKLSQREINPNENSWDRLDKMLTAQEEKAKKKYSWIYVAASLLGFVFLGTFFFNQMDKNLAIESKEVVIGKSPKVMPKIDVLSTLPLESKSEVAVVISEAYKPKKNSRGANSISQNRNQVVQNSDSDNLIPINEKKYSYQKEEKDISSNTNEKSIDEMLALAKTTLKSDDSKTTVKVNSNNLLSQVDGELELSFREKVINKVSKNYQTVKVALANRNLE